MWARRYTAYFYAQIPARGDYRPLASQQNHLVCCINKVILFRAGEYWVYLPDEQARWR